MATIWWSAGGLFYYNILNTEEIIIGIKLLTGNQENSPKIATRVSGNG